MRKVFRTGGKRRNSVGDLGGWFGPTIVGWIADKTDGFQGGLYALAAFCVLAAVVTMIGAASPRRMEAATVVSAAAE